MRIEKKPYPPVPPGAEDFFGAAEDGNPAFFRTPSGAVIFLDEPDLDTVRPHGYWRPVIAATALWFWEEYGNKLALDDKPKVKENRAVQDGIKFWRKWGGMSDPYNDFS